MIQDLRLPALRRFAIAISVLNIFGHAVLGFEQSLALSKYLHTLRVCSRGDGDADDW